MGLNLLSLVFRVSFVIPSCQGYGWTVFFKTKRNDDTFKDSRIQGFKE